MAAITRGSSRLEIEGKAERAPFSPFRSTLAVDRPSRRHGHRLLVLVAVVDAATGDVVGRDLEPYAVAGENADAVLAHAAAGVGEHAGTILQRDAEIRVRQHLEHGAVHLQHFFLGHDKSLSCARRARCSVPVMTTAGGKLQPPLYLCEEPLSEGGNRRA